MPHLPAVRLNLGLFMTTAALGLGALLVDTSDPGEEDFSGRVRAVALAEWLQDRRSGLYLADLRSRSAWEADHLPQAKQMTEKDLQGLVESVEAEGPDAVVVLYGPGDGRAEREYHRLRREGFQQVLYMENGLTEWRHEVMYPVLRSGATDEERDDFARAAALSRYFGGRARKALIDSGTEQKTPLRPSREGCGF